ncbi:unnamed protein product [Ectocarpus sp. 12 AP-2014]
MSSPSNGIVVVGCVSDASFHRCCRLVRVLNDFGISARVTSMPLYETQWEEYLKEKKTQVGGRIFEHTAKHLVLQDGGRTYMGGIEELIRFAEATVAPPFDRSEGDNTDWVAIAQQQCEKHLASSQCPLVFMDISLDPSARPQRVVFQLYSQDCPTTCENFRALCTGEKGISSNGKKLNYKGSPFHRVVRDGWVQGGDIVSGTGDGGWSIYGEVFGDESFAIKLNEAGVLAMANDGPHTNGSQFLVTLAPQPWLNHKVVGFGRVIKGLKVLREMSEGETLNQRPVMECKVHKCGQITPEDFAKFTCK